MVSALGKNIPVFESPLGLIDGAEVLPAETTRPLENVAMPEELTVPVTLPVKFPLKVVAVTLSVPIDTLFPTVMELATEIVLTPEILLKLMIAIYLII
jgi:hypothetical protein